MGTVQWTGALACSCCSMPCYLGDVGGWGMCSIYVLVQDIRFLMCLPRRIFLLRQCKSAQCKSVQSASALVGSVCHYVPGMFPNGSVSPCSVSPSSRHQVLVSSVCHCVPGLFPNGSVSPFSVSPFSRHQAWSAQFAVC